MKKLTAAACFAALLLLMWLSVRAAGVLPMPKAGLIAEKYESWTGVLRLWVYEGWPTGKNSLTTWLNFAIGKFEKSHPGVYVQAKRVDAQAIRELATSGVNPPDLIIFPPGLLENADNLAVLTIDAPLRESLTQSAYTLPVAMGAYALAQADENISPSLLSADEPYRNISGALLCLYSDSSETDQSSPSPQPQLPDLDLGLPDLNSNSAITVSGAHSGRAAETTVSAVCAQNTPTLNPNPRVSAHGDSQGAMSLEQGIQGDSVPLVVTQRELHNSDLSVAIPGRYMFADQLALMAVVDWPRDDAAERKQLGEELIVHLLSTEIQEELSRSGAFPVRADAIAYSDRGAMAQIEAAMAEKIMVAPPFFGSDWRTEADTLLSEFLSGNISADEAVRRFTEN